MSLWGIGDIDEWISYFYTSFAWKCIVFWKNLYGWTKFYTTAGRDGRDKSQLCLIGAHPDNVYIRKSTSPFSWDNAFRISGSLGDPCQRCLCRKDWRLLQEWRKFLPQLTEPWSVRFDPHDIASLSNNVNSLTPCFNNYWKLRCLDSSTVPTCCKAPAKKLEVATQTKP